MSAKFVIQQRDDFFSFIFYTEDNKIIFISRLFRTELLCNNAIKELISACSNRKNLDKLDKSHSQFSFVVRDRKGVALGHSPVYFAQSSRDYAIRQLELQAADAVIESPEIKKRSAKSLY